MKSTINKHWDMERIFPNGMSEVFTETDATLEAMKQQLEPGHETEEIQKIIQTIDEVQTLYSTVFEIDEYVICISSENVKEPKGQALIEQSQQLKAKMNTLLLYFDQFLADMEEPVWKELMDSPEMKNARTFLIERRRKMGDRLQPEAEKVIHKLSLNGFDGWEELYEQEFSSLRVPVMEEGEEVILTFDQAFMKAMLTDDREVRHSISTAMLEVCDENKDRFAFIFNHFAGFRKDLYELRGWSDPLKEMYEQNRISAPAVHQMMNALHEHKSLLHQFLQRKASLNGLPKLNWYDLYAPTFTSKTTLTYDQATAIVTKQFSNYSEKLGRFADKAFRDGWVDAEPKENKRHGAFCASLPNKKESRVLLSFQGHYQDVVTMAHELGHAYHNLLLHEQPGFSQHAGTGLAETASTFAENLVLDAAIKQAETEEDALFLLEMKIINGLKYTTYIPAKFEFEQAFYEKRKQGILSSSEIIELMEQTERDWFEDSIEEVNPYNWMSIPHFFDTEKAFFNLPYTIGYLFSNGIYAEYENEPEGFPEKYDSLLFHSGNSSMESLSRQFLHSPLDQEDFWRQSFRPLSEAISEYMIRTEKFLLNR